MYKELLDSSTRAYIIRTYYKEGLKKGMYYGFAVGVVFTTGIISMIFFL